MAHKAKLTRSGDTALHIAVSDGFVDIVEELVGSIFPSKKDQKERALYGKKEAFLCLHELCGTENGYNYCRRKDGDTILHCAISGDYFGILVDELENEPSDQQPKGPRKRLNDQTNQNLEVVEVEKEPSDLNFKEIIIDECETKKQSQKESEISRELQNMLQLLASVSECDFIHQIPIVLGCGFILKCVRRDAKNLKGSKDTPGAAGFNATNGARHKVFPANYGTCFEFVKLASKSMLVIFGLGSSGIRKIEEKKKKHTWAIQIMNELLQYSSSYEYDYTTGTNPLAATPKKDVETTTPYDIGDGGTVNFALEDLFLPDQKVPSPRTIDTFETKQEDESNGSGGNEKTNEVLAMVVGSTTSQEVWNKLEEKFTCTARANVLNLKLELQGIKKGNESINSYLQRIKNTRNKLSTVGVLVDNEELLHMILKGLPKEFAPFASAIRTRDDSISFEKLSVLLQTEEQSMAVASDSFTNSALAMFVSNNHKPNNGFNGGQGYNRGRGRNSFNRGRGGRSFNSYPTQHQTQLPQSSNPTSQPSSQLGSQGKSKRPTCQICWKIGHYAIDCYHRMDFAYQGKNPPTKLAAMANASNLQYTQNSKTWLTDSGASDHITANASTLNTQAPYQGTEQVTVGNGQNLPIQSIDLHPLKQHVLLHLLHTNGSSGIQD
uniref:Uncharacterized protein n=1 Tax=Fagus sylvatica TaxID=28930 RepID=A0A2N9JBP8_FAGSY